MTRHPLPIEMHWPPERWCDTTVLVGVSGGPDSTALFRRLAEVRPSGARGRLVAAYFDHRWREGEGTGEAQFVRELARRFDQEAICGAASPATGTGGLGREGAARKDRYAFFARAARDLGARFLALGHTRDDQVETILHRLLRGTGLHGLGGMAMFRPWIDGVSLVRPLLRMPRAAVLDYLHQQGQTYLRDATNADCSFTRNRIRNELLPRLRHDYHPRIDEALLRLGQHAREQLELLAQLAEPLWETSAPVVSETLIGFATPPVLEVPRLVRTEFLRQLWRKAGWPLRRMTAEHWMRMADALEQPGAATTFPGDVVLQREGTRIRMTRRKHDTERPAESRP